MLCNTSSHKETGSSLIHLQMDATLLSSFNHGAVASVLALLLLNTFFGGVESAEANSTEPRVSDFYQRLQITLKQPSLPHSVEAVHCPKAQDTQEKQKSKKTKLKSANASSEF